MDAIRIVATNQSSSKTQGTHVTSRHGKFNIVTTACLYIDLPDRSIQETFVHIAITSMLIFCCTRSSNQLLLR